MSSGEVVPLAGIVMQIEQQVKASIDQQFPPAGPDRFLLTLRTTLARTAWVRRRARLLALRGERLTRS